MPELKRRPTPMPGTMKGFDYGHISSWRRRPSSTSSLQTRKHPRSKNRRGSNEIMNYIDHIIDNGAPPPQQLGSREITKPYTRLSDSNSIATTAPLEDSLSSIESLDRQKETEVFPFTIRADKTEDKPSTIGPLEDSLSSTEAFNGIEEKVVLSSTSKVDKTDDQSQTMAIWGWCSGLESIDGEIDIWDELYLSKCELAFNMR